MEDPPGFRWSAQLRRALACGAVSASMFSSGVAETERWPEPTPPDVIRAERIEPDGRLTFLPRWRAPSAPRWGVALSGGAALGLAHLGVLEGLEEDGVVPDMIAGTSAGALIGGLYASGHSPDAIERIFREKNWNAIFRETPRTRGISTELDPLDPHVAMGQTGQRADGAPLRWPGLVPDGPVFREFVRYYGRPGALAEGDLDRLPVPFRAVACDLETKESYAPRHAPLFAITRASIGLPIFPPVYLNGRVLVDGGVLENVPVPTVRSMGAEFVVAVPFRGSDDYKLSSFLSMLGRSYTVASGAQRQVAIQSADAVVEVDKGKIPSTDFFGSIDELIAAGLAAWRSNRDAVIAAMEAWRGDMAWYVVRSIDAGDDVSRPVARSISERLGLDGSPRRISSLRLEFELVRLLRTGRYRDASFVPAPDDRLRLVLLREPAVTRLTLVLPPALEPSLEGLRSLDGKGLTPNEVLRRTDQALLDAAREGYFLAGVRDVRWSAETGELHVVVEEGVLAEIHAVSPAGTPVPLTRSFRSLEGRPARIDDLERAIVKLGEAGDLWREGGSLKRTPDGYALGLPISDPPRWKASWNVGLADALGVALMGRIARPSGFGSKRWGSELRAGVSKEFFGVGLETSPAWDHPMVPFFRIGAARGGLRLYDEEGKPQDWTYFGTGIAGAGYRTAATPAGTLELGLKARLTSGPAFVLEPHDSPERDLAFEATWNGDIRNDPRNPRRGVAWSLGGALPLAWEDRPWVAFADVSVTARLGRRFSVSLLGRTTKTSDEDPLPADRWAEAGAYWEAPGLDAGRARAREVRRGTLVLRRQLGEPFGANLVAGVSGGWWRLSDERLDPFMRADGSGASFFLEASTARIGPITLGFAFSDVSGPEGAERWFILLHPDRIPWTGPGRRAGAVLP
jgi:predicted acylesterase/phospholipase RssA